MQTPKIKPKQPKQRKQQAIALATALTLALTLILQLFTPLTAHAEETERSLSFDASSMLTSKNDDIVLSNTYHLVTTGSGNFVAKSFTYEDADTNYFGGILIICSNKSFTYTGQKDGGSVTTATTSNVKDGVYYTSIGFSSSSTDSWEYVYSGLVNNSHFSSEDSYTEAKENFLATVDLSKDDYKDLTFDESTATYSSDIPTPKLTVNNDYSFGFNNASDDYYFQLKGRWYSVEDIELYKESLQWKYKYNSILKGSLSEWVTKQNKTLANTSNLNLATLGQTAFDSFLTSYPIDNRSYSGGTNALGNYFSGYNDALNTLKMLLGQPTSIYNGLEIYVRYYRFDENGIAQYGKWCHYYDNLASASGSTGSQWDDSENMFTGNQSSSGLDDEQFTDVENMQDSRNDVDLQPEYNDTGYGSIVLDNIDTTSLTNSLQSMYEQTKTFINMFGVVFNFLPPWIIALICASLGVICIIGIWKCIRG